MSPIQNHVIIIAIPSCQAKSVGLVHYPTTLAPVSGSKSVTTECADNAHIKSGFSLRVICHFNGNWSGVTPQCECNDGYRPATDNRKLFCEGRFILS